MAKPNPIVFKVGSSNVADAYAQSISDCDGHYTVTIYNKKTGAPYYERRGIKTFGEAYKHAVEQTAIIRREETF